MTEKEIIKVSNHIGSGGKLFVGHDYFGRRRVKITTGPFGVFTQRFEVYNDDLSRLLDLAAQKRLQQKPKQIKNLLAFFETAPKQLLDGVKQVMSLH